MELTFTTWVIIAVVSATLLGGVVIGRLVQYGGARVFFLAPAALVFSIFVLYPIVGSVWISFHDVRADRFICADGRSLEEARQAQDALGEAAPNCRRVPEMVWNDFSNYARFFDKFDRNFERLGTEVLKIVPFGKQFLDESDAEKPPRYPRLTKAGESLLNNAIWLILFQIAIPLGLALAVLLNQNAFVVRLLKPMFFFPFVLSPTVIAFIFQFFYSPFDGPLVWFYELVGWGKNGILGTQGWSTLGVIIAAWYPQIAYCIIIYLAGLTAINPELLEAGKLDGAQGFTLFRTIVMPQLWPATFICVVVTTIGALRSFDLVQVMTNGLQKSEVLARYMYDVGFGERGGDYGYGATISVILFAIMLAFIIFFVTNMVRQADS